MPVLVNRNAKQVLPVKVNVNPGIPRYQHRVPDPVVDNAVPNGYDNGSPASFGAAFWNDDTPDFLLGYSITQEKNPITK